MSTEDIYIFMEVIKTSSTQIKCLFAVCISLSMIHIMKDTNNTRYLDIIKYTYNIRCFGVLLIQKSDFD